MIIWKRKFSLELEGVAMRLGIRGRFVIAISAMLALFLTLSLGFHYRLMKQEATAVMDAQHEAELRRYLQEIDSFTSVQSAKAEGLAHMGEWIYTHEKEHPEVDSPHVAMSAALAHAKSSSDDALLGCGLWYEPNALEADRRWVGPYAVVDGPGRSRPNWEYSNDEYNYVKHDWYTIAIPEGWDTSKPRRDSLYMTEPYLDTLEGVPTVFVSFTHLMYSPDNKIIGVSTADWTLDSLAEDLKEFRVTKSSFAFLVHGQSRKVLFPGERNELALLEDAPWGAHIDPEMPGTNEVARVNEVNVGERTYDVIYTRTRAGFVFGLMLDSAEAYAFLNEIARQNLIIALATILIIALAAFWVVSRLLRPVRSLARSAQLISDGDLDHRSPIKTRDEIGALASSFNEAANRLIASEDRFRALIENASDVILMVAPDRTILYASPSLRRVLGTNPEEVIGRPLLNSVHVEEVDGAQQTLDHLMSGDSGIQGTEVRVRHSSGGYRILEVVGARFDLPDTGTCVVVNARDITDRKSAQDALRSSEEQLRQAQKLEAIGRLAGGVAHDFNNAMTAVLGHTDLLILKNERNPELLASLKDIRRAGEHATALTRQLLTLSRKHVGERSFIDVNRVVGGVERMLARVIGEDVELITRIEPDLPTVHADPSHLEQILVNLAVNARDAMDKGGRLTVETHLERVDEASVSVIGNVQPGLYVAIDVSDTGSGMSKDVLDKIFDPFFTTKDIDEGTGLGLSTVYGIVKDMVGHVFVESTKGRGSRFSILIPPQEGPISRPSTEGGTLTLGKGERILVVEDETIVREATVAILRTAGFRVLEANDGADALRQMETEQSLDLLLTDVVMPQMSGADLARAAERIRPDLPVIFISGYSAGELPSQLANAEGRAFMQKPYDPKRLVRLVRDLIDQVPRGERDAVVLH